MSNVIIRRLDTSVVLLAFCATALGAETVPVTLPATVQHELQAGPDGPTYRLFVGLPPGYDANGERRYPVAYVLDGNVVFPFALNAQRMFVLFGEAPEMIVVGVGYPVQFFMETFAARWHDLTPSHDDALDETYSARFGMQLRSGGGPEFLRFLRDEAIPFVDASYRTTDDRSLWGHSLGGLFALYALFEEPELFQRYGISSPSLNLGGGAIFAQEAAFAEGHRALPARVFVSLGSEELDISMETAQLVDVLQKREYGGLVLESRVFQDETHVSVFPAAFSRALKFLYAAPAGEGVPAAPGPVEID